MGAVAALLTALAGCSAPAPDPARTDVQRMLGLRAGAVLDRDRAAFLRTEAPTSDVRGQLATGAAEFTNLRGLPLASWTYRMTSFHRTGDRATAGAELRYRVRGHDRGPVRAARDLTLVRDGGTWRVAADEPARGAAQQLWEQGPVRAVRGAHSLVLGAGGEHRTLREYAALADRAVPAVDGAWSGEWPRRVVVLVPASLKGMAGLLGAPASAYRGIAAVTTGETGGSARTPADRIVVNPEAYRVLGTPGRQVVFTHETTHVATRAHTNAATPLWLSEGYADWVGYRDTDRSLAEIAPELRRAVRAGEPPKELPADGDFGFDGDAADLSRAYESGWLACRMIADRWGEDRLNAFYRAVGAHGKREGAVEGALEKVLGTTPDRFTAQWRTYLRAELG